MKVENSENGSKLTILAARQEHCGCYTLLVENKLGSRQAQVNLTVVGESGGWVAWSLGQGEGREPPGKIRGPQDFVTRSLSPLLCLIYKAPQKEDHGNLQTPC